MARLQIADIFGNGSLEGIGLKMAENYALLQDVLDVEQSAGWQTTVTMMSSFFRFISFRWSNLNHLFFVCRLKF